MTTYYATSSHLGSRIRNDVYGPVRFPLTVPKTPNSLSTIQHGELKGMRPTPYQFPIVPLDSEESINSRAIYKYSLPLKTNMIDYENARTLTPMKYHVSSLNRSFPVSIKKQNYTSPICSSQYSRLKKTIAIGKTDYKIGLPYNQPLSTKGVDRSYVQSKLRSVRNGGCTAPKKYSIQYLNNRSGYLGAFHRVGTFATPDVHWYPTLPILS